MTVFLKKRASELITQVEQIAAPLHKRLRLTYNTPAEDLRINLDKCTNTKDILEVLNEIEWNILKLDVTLIADIINVLFDKLNIEKEEIIKDVLSLTIRKICIKSIENSFSCIKLILEKLNDEKSQSVIAQFLDLLNLIGEKIKLENHLTVQILDIAYKELNNKSYRIRSKCLNIIGQYGYHNSKLGLFDLLNFTADPDWRVRSAAFKNILRWHNRALPLELESYLIIRKGLEDSNESVRIDSLRIISAIGTLIPDSIINNTSTTSMRLVDACFMDICDAFNDSAIKVRLEASILLGKLKMVSPYILMQTLDKKLMNDLRVKKSAHEKNRKIYEDHSEFSSGQKFGFDAPKKVDECSSLVPISACGAFVHGLEDEFLCVRNATIESLCQLTLSIDLSSTHVALEKNKFVVQCSDYLVDMFNDEIDDVRLRAVQALAKISHLFLLRDEQFDFIVSILKDFYIDIRTSCHQLLARCNPASKNILSTIIHALLENLSKYPIDKHSIWSCMKEMGEKQSQLVLALIPELLSIHPYFETKEHELDDPVYIGVLILVFNALPKSSAMLPMLPPFLSRHYLHLRNSLPDFIPIIKFGQFATIVQQCAGNVESKEKMLISLFYKIDRNIKLSSDNLLVLSLSIRDLKQVSKLMNGLKSKINCQIIFLQCYLCIFKILHIYNKQEEMLQIQNQRITCLLKKTTLKLSQLECSFRNLSISDMEKINLLNTQINLIKWLLFKNSIIRRDNFIKEFFLLFSNAKLTDEKLIMLINVLKETPSDDAKEIIEYFYNNTNISLLKLQENVMEAKVNILSPQVDLDTVYHFLPNMVMSLPLIVDLLHFSNINNLRINVEYPDGSNYLIVPPNRDFKDLSNGLVRLTTRVFISHHQWTDACKVKIALVIVCPTDNDKMNSEDNLVHLAQPLVLTIQPSLKRDKHFN